MIGVRRASEGLCGNVTRLSPTLDTPSIWRSKSSNTIWGTLTRQVRLSGNQNHRLPTHQEIAERAFHIFLERGGKDGHAMDDWLQAEYELLQLPIHKIARLEAPKTSRGTPLRKSIVGLVHMGLLLAVLP